MVISFSVGILSIQNPGECKDLVKKKVSRLAMRSIFDYPPDNSKLFRCTFVVRAV